MLSSPMSMFSHRARHSLAALLFWFTLGDIQAQQTPRAVPVTEDGVVSPRAVPFPQAGSPPRAAVVVDDKPKPTGPDEDLYDYAALLYEKKEYPLAADSLAQYLQRYPTGRHVAVVMFSLGECYVNQNQLAEAERYYIEVVTRYPSSEGAPSAAYRLGAIRFNEKQFDDSARYFAFCESKTTFAQIKLAAAYNKSRAYQMAGDKKKALLALNAVVAIKTDNPYRESALLSLGTALLAENKKKEALAMFTDLISVSKDNAVLSDALVKAGVIEAETGEADAAIKHFEQALSLGDTTPENRGIALVGSVQALFAKGDYNAVIDAYNRNASALPPGDLRPKMQLLLGHAHRMRKTYSRAVEQYVMVEQSAPESDQAFEAGYWKLYCFYLLSDKDLPEHVRVFLEKYAKARSGHELISKARLILADAHFNAGKYADAADAFTLVDVKSLPEKLRAGSLFNKGWAEAESGRHQPAIASLSEFLIDYPKHEYVAKALARRGLSYRETRDMDKAQADFARLKKDFPDDEATELAYLQSGLIHMEARELKEMIADFETLLKKFPKSPAAGQAWFCIGRGQFESKQFDKATPALKKSIEADRATYLDRASPLIILSAYARQDADALASAIDEYRDANKNASINQDAINWLGVALFNKGDHARSARFLTHATMSYPTSTPPAIWDYLARAWLEMKKYDDSLEAVEKLLENPPDLSVKARGLLTKSRALMGLTKFSEADSIVKEALQIIKDGTLQAQLLIHEGDIYYAEANSLQAAGDRAAAIAKHKDAAAKYIVPSQMFVDKRITPEALFKAARSLEKAGEKAKAEDLLRQLKEKYPDYKPTEVEMAE